MVELSQERSTPGVRRRARRWLVASLGLFLAMAGLLVAVAMGWILPREYESMAVIQVTEVAEQRDGLTAAEATLLMESEARRVVALPTIDRVRERLRLEERWGLESDEVREALRGAVAVEPVPETGLIRIRARRPDPREARLLALTVAEVYRDLRNGEAEAAARGMLEALDAEIREQEREVERKREELQRLLEEHGPALREQSKVLEEDEDAAIGRSEEFNRLELEAEGRRLDVILAGLEERRGDELYAYAAALVLPQNTVAVIFPEYESELAESRRLRASGFGEAHPLVVENEVRLSMLGSDLERAVKKMRERTAHLRSHLERRKAMSLNWDDESKERLLALWRNGLLLRNVSDGLEKRQEVLETLRRARLARGIEVRGWMAPVEVARSPEAGGELARPARWVVGAAAAVVAVLVAGGWVRVARG